MVGKCSNGIPTRLLGSTGEYVTAICVGGYHIGRVSYALGMRIIRRAIDEGITCLDNAWCYNDGDSERIMGRALVGGYRDRVLLMTKNHGRDGETFRRQLEESLRRLRTDHIDLVQFHAISRSDEPGRIWSEGAIDAALEARGQGKLRFVGFTGHTSPKLHAEMLALDMKWDTVQMPVNLLDAQYDSFAKNVLPILKERGIGVIGMKSLASGRLLRTGTSASAATLYALSQPVDSLVCGIDSLAVLEQDLAIARSWKPMSASDQLNLLRTVAKDAADGHLEHYKRH